MIIYNSICPVEIDFANNNINLNINDYTEIYVMLNELIHLYIFMQSSKRYILCVIIKQLIIILVNRSEIKYYNINVQ